MTTPAGVRILLKKIRSAFSLTAREHKRSSWEVYGDYIRIHPAAIIDPSASVKFFSPPDPPTICLEIGEGSHIFSSFNFLTPSAKIKVGKFCELGAVNLVCADSIEIGDFVLMAWGITIMDNDAHSLDFQERIVDIRNSYRQQREPWIDQLSSKNWSAVQKRPIVIKNFSWIGFNASILKGTTIGEKAVVGAGSVVTGDVPACVVVAGNPAKIIKKLPNGENLV